MKRRDIRLDLLIRPSACLSVSRKGKYLVETAFLAMALIPVSNHSYSVQQKINKDVQRHSFILIDQESLK